MERILRFLFQKIDGERAFLLVVELIYSILLVIGIVEVRSELRFLPLFIFACSAAILVRGLAARIKQAWKMLAATFSAGGLIVFVISSKLVIPLISFSFVYTVATFQRTIQGILNVFTYLIFTADQITGNVSSFTANLLFWLGRFSQGRISRMEQPLTFVFGMMVFSVTVWLGWFLHRRAKPNLAIVPGLLALGIFVDYSNTTVIYLALLLGYSFFVSTVFNHYVREQNWEKAGFGYSRELRLDIRWTSFLLSMLIFLTAFLVPSISAKEIVEEINELKEPSRVVSNTKQSNGPPALDSLPIDDMVPGILPSSHLITSPPEQLDINLFQVRIKNSNTGNRPESFYWRVKTLEQYTGWGWLSGSANRVLLQAGEDLQSDHLVIDNIFDLDITVQSDQVGGVLIYSGQLVHTGTPVELNFRRNQAIAEEIVYGELDDDSYSVTVHLPKDWIWEDESNRDTDYEEWVKEIYLALPDTIPSRVRRLGEIIVQDQADAYSRALAIEAYLRGIPYSLDVGLPSEDRDVVDYFLFDLRTGYCDYYASSMVVLARSVGLPARLVVGYASGAYNVDAQAFQVTGKEGHTWVEVYISGLGWVEFEPTAGLPPIERDYFAIQNELNSRENEEETSPGLQFKLTNKMLLISIFSIVFLPVLFLLSVLIWYATRSMPEVLLAVKKQFYLLVKHIGLHQPETLTLLELQSESNKKLLSGKKYPFKKNLINGINNLVSDSGNALAEIAYTGKEISSFKKSDFVRYIVRLKRFVFFYYLIGLFSNDG